MAFEISGIKIIADILIASIEQLGKLKGTPKKRLVQMLVPLSLILKKANENTKGILDLLNKLEKGRKDKERIKLIDDLRAGLRELGDISYEFITWVDMHEAFSVKLDLLYTTWMSSINSLVHLETFGARRRRADGVKSYFDYLSNISPDRVQLISAKKQILEINKATNAMMLAVRELAIANLTVEDLF